MGNKKSIKKTVYAISYTAVTIDGDVERTTKWFESLSQLPDILHRQNAKIIQRSFDVYEIPRLEDFINIKKTSEKYWLKANEEIKEIA